jgi:hypothetical protein
MLFKILFPVKFKQEWARYSIANTKVIENKLNPNLIAKFQQYLRQGHKINGKLRQRWTDILSSCFKYHDYHGPFKEAMCFLTPKLLGTKTNFVLSIWPWEKFII